MKKSKIIKRDNYTKQTKTHRYEKDGKIFKQKKKKESPKY